MLLGTLGASLLGNLLSEKRGIVENQGQGIVRVGYGAKGADYGLKKKLIPIHPLTNFEMQNYCKK